MMMKNVFLFETSWEVCNKVGGIYTVLRSKLKEATKNFGENYLLIGPWLQENRHFVDSSSPFLEKVSQALTKKGIACRTGYWDTEGKPAVILVGMQNRYKIDELLYRLWSNFGVDSLASNYEYIEPLLFATVSGEIIQTIAEQILDPKLKVIAHFHEWLCGAGVLHLKQFAKKIAIVFTTHATVLGRALAHNQKDIYNLTAAFNPSNEARSLGVYPKHSLERAAAMEAHCFTTVSSITAEEAYLMLDKYPDKIVLNGLDIIDKIQHSDLPNNIIDTREKLLNIARKTTQKPIPNDALIWLTSGRYEFHNKGFDIFLKSLAKLDKKLTESSPTIVVLFLIAANHRNKQDSLLEEGAQSDSSQQPAIGIATHKIYNPFADPIINLVNELNLKESKKIRVVYSDAYLNGADGVFDIIYESILATCNLSIFPSFYEPWGYTPLESIAYGVPTITTDLAGFGCWIKGIKEDHRDSVFVLEYRNKDPDTVIENLSDYLGINAYQEQTKRIEIKNKTKLIARLGDWRVSYNGYIDAYNQAIEFIEVIYFPKVLEEKGVICLYEKGSIKPKFRMLQYAYQLPEKLSELRDLAYNFWWSWNEMASKPIFKDIDPVLWGRVKENPTEFFQLLSSSALQRKANEPNYMKKYENVLMLFRDYLHNNPKPNFCDANLINEKHPIAYFCLEYGLDECLPIYSGGLGILAGDYLKAVSDLNIPLIAIGLFYKQGYFTQKINFQGEQIASYDINNPSQLPMRQINDSSGAPLLINIEVLNRSVYITVWEVKVGKINLYLLDTDVDKNSPEDRKLSGRLYGGSREYRLMQEIVLGIGGTRFIVEQLKITPSLYHLNEGHSAFLLLERLKDFYNQNLSPSESYEAVRASSVFTTHTSVPAGNEVFADEIIIKYFSKAMKLLNKPMDSLLNLAKTQDSTTKAFSLTALALHCALGRNAVSKIHERVAKQMWKELWTGFLENEIPITSVTNGVHLPTWLGADLELIYDRYLGADWVKMQDDPNLWESINSIPDKALWDAHQNQKNKLLDLVKEHIKQEYILRNENETLIHSSLDCLSDEVLLIGISRRFATYKRHDLILRNVERLARILTDAKHPVVLLIAGKAHPADGLGQKLITEIIHILRRPIFKGHIIFLRNYAMKMAKYLVQGVDVWLNTPIINTEACGTSGMKVGLNGGLNFSIKDGWWAEAYENEPNSGWAITSFDSPDSHRRDEMENIFLLDILEHEIVPLYYNGGKGAISSQWIKKMKAAIKYISYQFNAQRMVKDYFERLYNPVAQYSNKLFKDNFKQLKYLAEWKKDLIMRFNTVKIKTILVKGLENGKVKPNGNISIKVLLFSGKMKSHELKVQLVLGVSDENQFISEPISIVPLNLADMRESGVLTYTVEHHLEDTGFFAYGIRVLPYNELFFSPEDAEITLWG